MEFPRGARFTPPKWPARFRYEKNETWTQDNDVKRRWYEALEAMGPDRVRADMTNVRGGPPGCINIGAGRNVTIGFIYDWLTWHERRARCRDNIVGTLKWLIPIILTVIGIIIALKWFPSNQPPMTE
jgi:hypothetical protein